MLSNGIYQDSALEVSDGKVSFGNINVGIGTDNAQVPLHISGARPAIRFTDTEQMELQILK